MNGTASRRSAYPPATGWAPPTELHAKSWTEEHSRSVFHARRWRAQGGLIRQMLYAVIDVCLVCCSAFVIYGIRFGFSNMWAEVIAPKQMLGYLSFRAYPGFLVLYCSLIVLACMNQGLYRTPRELTAFLESKRVAKAVLVATTLLVLFIFTSGNKDISRLVVTLTGATNIVTLSGWRYAKRRVVFHRSQRGVGQSRVLIVGSGKMGTAFANWLQENRHLGYDVCGFVDVHPNGDKRTLGSVSELRRLALAHFVDEVFVTLPSDGEMIKKLFLEVRELKLNLHVLPDLYDGLAWRAPLLLAVAVWIKFDSKGPALYRAARLGRKGNRFICYKLRTMAATADQQKQELRQANERQGPFFKMEEDPRVTRCGRWLRKFSIDEFPQLLNVLKGDMSLVGPRPHPVDDYEQYTIEHLRRLDVKPGMTGLWQVTARRDPSFDTNMALDLEYIENWSLGLDMKILLRTIPAVLRAEGR